MAYNGRDRIDNMKCPFCKKDIDIVDGRTSKHSYPFTNYYGMQPSDEYRLCPMSGHVIRQFQTPVKPCQLELDLDLK